MNNSEHIKNGNLQYKPSLVKQWDNLIDWKKRQASENGFFTNCLKKRNARRVLDVATGTGFHSVSLMQAGFDVLSCDGSSEMLRFAKENGKKYNVALKTIVADWRGLDDQIPGKFDAIICTGSSFPHIFTIEDRIKTLQNFFSKLKPGGQLIIDHRNFDAIRAQCYKSSGNYYYCGTDVDVSIDHIDESLCRFRYRFNNNTVHKLEVYPILTEELQSLLKQVGFSGITTHGDFQAKYDILKSDFIIHVAVK